MNKKNYSSFPYDTGVPNQFENDQPGLILNIRKPIGWTSNDVVRKIQKQVQGVKIGHAGTLDPFADGVLLVCLGKATKNVSLLMELNKVYLASIRFGIETDTLDVSGNILSVKKPHGNLDVQKVIPKFIGKIEQFPPSFSALKVKGQRAYDLARSGRKVEIPSRLVTVHDIKVVAAEKDRVDFKIECSKGTYIRALARDIAHELGTIGYVQKLSRISVGEYKIEDSLFLSELDTIKFR